MASVRFLFDFLSPYAYLAWQEVHGVAARHGREVEPVPVLLAGLLTHHGNVGPAEIPAKRRYVWKDVLRRAAALDVPLVPPPSHPFNPLLALRAASVDGPPEARHAFIDAVFTATWGTGQDVTSPDVLARLAEESGLPDAPAWAGSPEAKARLRDDTEAAIGAGVFGVPTMLAEGELFWGHDSLPFLDAFLGGQDVVAADVVARWVQLPSTASRR